MGYVKGLLGGGLFCSFGSLVRAGNLDSPAFPDSPDSAMFTLFTDMFWKPKHCNQKQIIIDSEDWPCNMHDHGKGENS